MNISFRRPDRPFAANRLAVFVRDLLLLLQREPEDDGAGGDRTPAGLYFGLCIDLSIIEV